MTWLSLEDIKSIESRLDSEKGELDRVWCRSIDGTLFHNGPDNHSASVEYETGLKIRDLIIQAKPSVIVDVGTNMGHSSTWLLLGAQHNRLGEVWTYDIQDWRAPGTEFFWRRYGLPDARFIKSAVWEPGVLPDKVDFVFHDASHDVSPTLRELEALCPRLSSGGMVVMHDHLLCRDQGEAAERWFRDRSAEWSFDVWPYGRGLGIARRK